MNRASISTILHNGHSRLNLWTDKDVHLWTETEQDLLRLIHKTNITISRYEAEGGLGPSIKSITFSSVHFFP